MPNYIKTCSFLHPHHNIESEKVVEKFVKNLFYGEKHSFIEWTYFVGLHWNCLFEAIPMCVVEQKYFTCPSRESNPGRWIYRQTLYQVVKAGFYRKAVEVCNIPSPVTFSPTKLNFVPEVPGHRESFLMRLGELLPGSRMGYLRWAPLS